MINLYLHIEGLETTMVQVDEMPDPTHAVLVGKNPQTRDGKEPRYLLTGVNTILVPMNRIIFIEVMPSGEEEEIETFIRD